MSIYLSVQAIWVRSQKKLLRFLETDLECRRKEGRIVSCVCECSSLVCLSIPYWRCVCAEDVMEVGKRDGRIERGKEIRCMSFVFCRANTALEF